MVDSCGVTIFQKYHENPEAIVGRNRMRDGLNLDLNFDFFSGKRVDDIVILNF